MALQQGPLGLISGTVGDKVYVVRYGNSYLRSLQKKPDNAPTEKQLIHRNKFALVMGFLRPIAPIIDEIYRKINRKKTGTRVAANQIFHEALKGEYPNMAIDYSRVLLIRGSLAAPDATMTYVAGSNELDFSWSPCTQPNSYHNDELLGFIYCPALNEFWYDLNLGIRRDDEFCTIQIPDLFCGRDIHVWLAYRSADQRAYSNTRYMGGIRKEKWEILGEWLDGLHLI